MKTKVKPNIKNNLKKYRTWKNLTRKELAKELNISDMTIVLIENHNRYPRYPIRAKICKYFEVSFDQMFYLEV